MAKQLTKKAMLELLDAKVLKAIRHMEFIKNHKFIGEAEREVRLRDAQRKYITLDALNDEFMGEAK